MSATKFYVVRLSFAFMLDATHDIVGGNISEWGKNPIRNIKLNEQNLYKSFVFLTKNSHLSDPKIRESTFRMWKKNRSLPW